MKYNISFLLVGFMFFASCGAKKNYTPPLTAQVNVIAEDGHKTIELRSVATDKDYDKASYEAETKAFKILFFRGIPNTAIENPLIGSNENELMRKHAPYFNDFFSNRYKSFIMSVYDSSPSQKNKGFVTVAKDIKINLISLKKDLEENGVIRKFGF